MLRPLVHSCSPRLASELRWPADANLNTLPLPSSFWVYSGTRVFALSTKRAKQAEPTWAFRVKQANCFCNFKSLSRAHAEIKGKADFLWISAFSGVDKANPPAQRSSRSTVLGSNATSGTRFHQKRPPRLDRLLFAQSAELERDAGFFAANIHGDVDCRAVVMLECEHTCAPRIPRQRFTSSKSSDWLPRVIRNSDVPVCPIVTSLTSHFLRRPTGTRVCSARIFSPTPERPLCLT